VGLVTNVTHTPVDQESTWITIESVHVVRNVIYERENGTYNAECDKDE
jgi:hypothetical protein